LTRRGNNRRDVREEDIFMAPDKFYSDASECSLAHVIDGQFKAMIPRAQAMCIAIKMDIDHRRESENPNIGLNVLKSPQHFRPVTFHHSSPYSKCARPSASI
jgi:hypothetical protein